MNKLICALILLLSSLAEAQTTLVTAQIKDSNNSIYANCQWSVVFVNQNTTPGAGPSQPANLLNGYQGNCDSFGNLTVALADNINTITPTPSQWSFSICSAQGYVAGPYCRTNILVTVTGISQNLTTFFQPLMPLLPPTSGGGGTLPTATIGKVLASQGINVNPVFQTKTVLDIRDFSFVCDGVTYNTASAQNMISAAGTSLVSVVGLETTGDCGVGDLIWPANITLDFSTGWRLKTLTDSTTSPGGGAFDSTSGASGQCQSNGTSPTCSISVSAPANDTYVVVCMRGFSSGAGVFTSSVASDVILPLTGSSVSQHSITQGALIPSVVTGSHTFTITFPSNLIGACSAIPISGLGPVPNLDGAGAIVSAGSLSSPMSATATFQSGSFLLAWGGQNSNAATCTAGAGFTQPSGSVGNSTTTASVLCVEYQNSASAGSTTASQTYTPSPSTNQWSYQLIGLRPSSAVNQILGGINDPTGAQIFSNATGTAGLIDFTGNLAPIKVYPEWWGANVNASTSANTAAIQAAIKGAYGNQNRINGSGLNQYNKELIIDQQFQINGELQMYHVSGPPPGARAKMRCTNGGGLTQTASNQRILDMQSVAYWDMHDCSLSTTVSQDATHPLVDDDFDNTHGADFAPQFTTFYNDSFNGNNLAAIGILGAKSGGGAQYSNIYSLDNEMIGFTQACYQIGTPSKLATNALVIGYSGDMQSCPLYGMVTYGGGYVSISAGSNGMSSMENSSSGTGGYGSQTGFDMAGSQMQGPCIMEHLRSESRKLISCPTIILKDSRTFSQALTVTPGTTDPVGTIMQNDYVTGDGAYYKVTANTSGFGGVGTVSAPLTASSGTSTSLTDTNETVAGSVTIGQPGVTTTETMTQATSGSTATRLNSPNSTGSIAGTLNTGVIAFGDSMSQATTSVTCTAGSGNTATAFNCSNFSGAPDNSHLWTDSTSSATFTPSATPVFTATSMLITAATGTPDNTHDWVGGTTGLHFTPTATPVNEANFTTNAFNGMFLGIISGTDGLCKATVTSNSAQTINFTGGFSTTYPYVTCTANTDTTSKYEVTPAWSHSGTVTSGGMSMTYVNEKIVSGDILFDLGAQGTMEDAYLPGGQIGINSSPGTNPTLRNVTSTRADWYVSNQDPQQFQTHRDWQVQAVLPGSPSNRPVTWTYPSLTGTSQTLAYRRDWGADSLCWNTGTIGVSGPPSNTSANEVCIGGRSDQGAGTDSFRNRVEIIGGTIGGIGPSVPTGTDQNGTDMNILGGGSTGAGTGGKINFRISNTGSSSATPNGGTTKAGVDSSGLLSSYDGSFGTQYGQAASACETSFGITTLSIVGATTDTGLNCLPANAVIDAVLYRITTTITTAASFTIGDSSTANRFCTTQSTLTAGTTGICFAQSGTSAQQQVSAAKVRVTANTTPGAGAIRLIVYYHTWVAPTS